MIDHLSLFMNLLLAHVIADFWLQTDKMVADKTSNWLGGYAIYLHVIIVSVLSWVVVGDIRFWPYLLAIAGTHIVFDLAKVGFKSKPFWPFVFDQLLHGMVLYVVAGWFLVEVRWSQWAFVSGDLRVMGPMVLVVLVLLTTPANILIREVFEMEKAKLSDFMEYRKNDSSGLPRLENAGALIGTLERVLTFIFVMNGNYQAVGFVVAAKSLLRFKESEGTRAEYVLVGTLLSFSIAILCALAVQIVKGLISGL